MKILILIFLLTSNSILAGLVIKPFDAFEITKNQINHFDFSKETGPTVVAFISKDCPCSKGNIPYLKEMANQFKNINFIAIHAKKDTTNAEIANYLKENQLNFKTINDDKLIISDNFKALKTPHIFIVSNKNEIIYNGAVSNSTFPTDASEFYLKNALIDLTNNKSISKNETKTLGCFIVR